VTHIVEKIGAGLAGLVKKAENATSGMATNLIKGGLVATATGGVLLAVAAGEATAVVHMAESVAELGHQQEELSVKFGLGAQQAGLWAAAADAVGVSSDTMGVGFKTLARNMEALKLLDNAAASKELLKEQQAEAAMEAKLIPLKATHNKTLISQQEALIATAQAHIKNMQASLANADAGRAMQQVFDQMGVVTRDAKGNLAPLNDVMLQVATKLAAMPDGAEKAGLAIKLFGRSGTDMLPLLDQGAAGIQKFMDEAELSGKVLDDSQVKEAQAAYLAHKQLDQAISGVTTQLSMAFLPILQKFLEVLTPILRNMADWIKHHEKLLSVLIPVVIGLTALLGIVLIVVGAIMTIAGVIMAWGVVTAALAPIMAGLAVAIGPVIIIVAIFIALALAVWFAVTHWTEIKAIAASVWQAIVDMGARIADTFHALVALVESVWSEFWKRPFYYIGLLVGFVIVKAIQIYNTVTDWTKKMVLNFITFWEELPDNAIRIFAEMIVAVSGWLDKAVPQMLKAGGQLKDSLWTELKKLPGLALDLGLQIAKGVLKGLTSIPGQVKKAAGDFIGGLLQGAKDAAGIHSPALLFSNVIGRPIAQGVAHGIIAGIPANVAAIKALTHATLRHAVPSSAGPVSVNSASVGTSGAGALAGSAVESLLTEIRDLIKNGALGGTGATGNTGALSPSDVLSAFNHLVEAAQMQRSRGTRAGYVT